MKLALAPRFNTGVKHDATGAFQPEALEFCRVHGGTLRLFDNTKPMAGRFREVMGWIGQCEPASIDTFAAFCHGFKSGLQIGATTANAAELAGALQRVFRPGERRVTLYSCDAARDSDNDRVDDLVPGPGGEGGFADKLRDELVRRGVMATIFAHATTAHSTMNPFVRRFDPDDLAGGRWVIVPHSEDWAAWSRSLHSSMRFRFPYMTQSEIEAELRAPRVA